MAKKKTAAEIKAHKAKRAEYNKSILQVEIPKFIPGGEISPLSFYVVYEANLLKPVVLNKAFKTHSFAVTYVNKNLANKRANIVSGKQLIGYGFQKAIRSHIKLVGEHPKTSGINYAFDKELSPQRRKTLRTMFRRNLRRILIKIIQDGQR